MRYLQWIVNHRRLVSLLFLVLAVSLAPGLLRLHLDNAPEAFFVRDHEALESYRDFEFHFGRNRMLRIAVQGEGVWQAAGLEWLGRLEREAAALQGVLGVAGLYGHHGWRFADWPPVDPLEFRQQVLADPLDRQAGWISQDGSVVSILVGLFQLTPSLQERTLQQLRALLANPPPGVVADISGLAVINQALDGMQRDMAMVFFPLLLVLGVVILLVALGRPRQILPPLLLVGLCQTVVFGSMGYLGASLNVVTSVLPPLIFVISLATALHLLLYFRRQRQQGLEPEAAVLETYRIKGWPVIWTGITTCVGFGSLAVSQVPPVFALGLWSVFAFSFMTFAVLTLYPALLAGASLSGQANGPRPLEDWARARGRAWAEWAVARRRQLFVGSAALAAVWLLGLGQLRVESNVIEYFPPDHPVRQQLTRLQERGVGTVTAEIVIVKDKTDNGGYRQTGILLQLAELARQIRSLPAVLGVVSGGDLLQGIARYLEPAGQDDVFTGALKQMEQRPAFSQMLNFFVTPDGSRARIMLMLPMLGFQQLEPILLQARNQVQQQFPEAEVRITGQFPLVLAAQKTLLRTMWTSLLLTLACIALIFRGVLGSWQMAARALVPNLWPVVFVLAAMGWFGVPIDSTTVMIASVALGLAVDDTLHSLGSFRRLVDEMEPDPAAAATLERTAGAHMLTSLILAVGFGACGLSAFVPVAQFGALSALAILVALIADLLLVPALFASAPPRALERLRRLS